MGGGNFLEAEERQPEPEDHLDRATEPSSSKYQNSNLITAAFANHISTFNGPRSALH